MDDQSKRFSIMSIVAMVLVMLALGYANFAYAGSEPRVTAQDSPLFVPTPITTPSMLDALQTTSDVIVGGNVSVAGSVTGMVLQYPTAGSRMVCGSDTITGTAAIAHGLATPQYVMHSLAADASGNQNLLSHTNASATVTVKVWNSALTPAAATTPIAVDWCVIGTP